MPVEKAKVTFFNIEKSGLYKYGEDQPTVGNLTAILDNLSSWSNGKGFARTLTYQVMGSSQLMPAYLFDIRKKNGNFLITIWNQVPSSSGAVASVDPNSNVGSVTVTMNPLKKGTIPGFATYFWFIPSLSVCASIQFQHTLIARNELEKYIEAFIDPLSKYVVFKNDKKKGYTVSKYIDDAGNQYDKLYSRFKMGIVRKPGDIQHILNNCPKLEKIVRKTKLEMKNKPDKTLMQNLVKFIERAKGISYKVSSSDINISYEIPIILTRSELGDMINDWNASNNHSRSEWDDYGFQFKGEMNKTYWLSSSLARDTFDLDITRSSDEVVEAQSLIDELSVKQTVITSLL